MNASVRLTESPGLLTARVRAEATGTMLRAVDESLRRAAELREERQKRREEERVLEERRERSLEARKQEERDAQELTRKAEELARKAVESDERVRAADLLAQARREAAGPADPLGRVDILA
ncbi:MAG: hypothetical protein SFZ24_01040 [Planctomycetota bacterium]|nr:hypothetical protein [Planctomycetota bacterium]